MTRAAVRPPGGKWRVVFDGQSLNNVGLVDPFEGGNYPYPDQVMSGRRVQWANVAISGKSWTDLATTAATRTDPLAGYATNTVLVMCGGTSDIHAGDSGQQLYDEEVAYATARRAAGYTHVIATTLVGNKGNTPEQNQARLDHNAILLADPDGAFDAVVDFDVPPLNDWNNTAIYFDGVHWWSTGAKIAAELMAPTLDALLV